MTEWVYVIVSRCCRHGFSDWIESIRAFRDKDNAIDFAHEQKMLGYYWQMLTITEKEWMEDE